MIEQTNFIHDERDASYADGDVDRLLKLGGVSCGLGGRMIEVAEALGFTCVATSESRR